MVCIYEKKGSSGKIPNEIIRLTITIKKEMILAITP